VRGVRFNPFRRSARPDLASARWRRTLAQIAALGWQVVAHEEDGALIQLLAQLEHCVARIVIDHLGRPGADRAINAAAEGAVLQRARCSPIFVKLSAPYRGEPTAAARAATRCLDALGPEELLWGSDGPWPNFGGRHDYAAMLDGLRLVLPRGEGRAAVHAAAACLYGFTADAG